MASSSIDLYVDEAHLLRLLNDEPIPMSDEKYAYELLLQETLFSSSSHPSFAQSSSLQPVESPKIEDEKQTIPENRDVENSKKPSNQENREINDVENSPEVKSMASSNIDLYVDEARLLNDEPIPISDEKYAYELLLQETPFSSSSHPSIAQSSSLQPVESPKIEDENQTIPENRDVENSKKQSNQEYREIGESSQSQLKFCGICMDYKQNPEIFKGLSDCNHEFCSDCIIKYIASKIKENIAMVECPDPKCKQTIQPENCSSILPGEVFDRWENALCEAMVFGWQKFYCPYKDCSVLMVDDGEEVRASECPSCRRLFCAKCQIPWHEGVTCEEFQSLEGNEREKEDMMVMKLAKDEKWRRCSNCRFYVEKTDGCLHMTCRCRYEFCYICGGKWSDNHQEKCVS